MNAEIIIKAQEWIEAEKVKGMKSIRRANSKDSKRPYTIIAPAQNVSDYIDIDSPAAVGIVADFLFMNPKATND